MKKIALALICFAFTKTTNAQGQTWETSLINIPVGQQSDLGTSNDMPINFFTNGAQRMVIDQDGFIKFNGLAGSGGSRFLQVDNDGVLSNWEGSTVNMNKVLFGDNTWRPFPFTITGSDVYMPNVDTRFGIGTSSPNAELDVVGSGKFTGNLKVDGVLTINDFGIRGLAASGSNPKILQFGGDPTAGIAWVQPCNLNWHPDNTQIYFDLIQLQGNNSVINFGMESMGDGVISLEPIVAPGSQKLKINPSCNNDVQICGGGGLTEIFYDARVGGSLKVGQGTWPSTPSQLGVMLHSAITKAITITDPNLTTTNKKIFEMAKNGETVLGVDVLPTAGTMLTIGQPDWNMDALSLIYTGSSAPTTNVFKVRGDGYTEIKALGTDVVSIFNGYNNSKIFSVDLTGYTEIFSTNPKSFVIKNINNSAESFAFYSDGRLVVKCSNSNVQGDVIQLLDANNANQVNFKVKKNGLVYAREVIVTLNTFPDYVFAKNYQLPKLMEVKDFVEKNHRLPGMPSAIEVKSIGANLGEIQKITVEKVEELYLYIFQLEEKINELNKKIETVELKK